MRIYHVVHSALWERRDPASDLAAESLATEGFIHCSYAAQLDGVIDRYFRGAGRVVVLEIETDRLTSKLVAEPSTNNEIFPHIYGVINPDAIVGASERTAD